jgi:RES domain-containing protein
MKVFRLQRFRHGMALSGEGAAIKGARWNSAGIKIIYTASNRSLAMAEIAVHFTYATLPSDYLMFEIFIPVNTSILILQESDLPANWNSNPPPLTAQSVGDDFIRENRYCLLKIPSAVTRGDFNILINPAHREFLNINVLNRESFPFDDRLFKLK